MYTSFLKMSANQSQALEGVHEFMHESLPIRSVQGTSKPTSTPKKSQIKYPSTPKVKPEPESDSDSESNSKSKSKSKSEPKTKSKSEPKAKPVKEPIPVPDSDSDSYSDSDSIILPENSTQFQTDEPKQAPPENIFSENESESSKIDKLYEEIKALKDNINKMTNQINDHGTQIWNSCKDIIELREDTDNILVTREDFHNVLNGVEQANKDLHEIRKDLRNVQEKLKKANAKLREKENERDCMEIGPIGRCVLARTNWNFIKNCVNCARSDKDIKHCLKRNLPTQHRLLIDCLGQDTADTLLREYFNKDCDPMEFWTVSRQVERTIEAAMERYQMEFDAGKRLIAPLKKDSKKEKDPRKEKEH